MRKTQAESNTAETASTAETEKATTATKRAATATNTKTEAAAWEIVHEEIMPLQDWQQLSPTIDGEHSYLLEYYLECRRGEIIIGRELKTTLEMLVQDIVYKKYIYDIAAAKKRISFIETQIKHFESPFACMPFLLTLNQKAIAEAIFAFYEERGGKVLRRFKEVLLLVGRKNGKTPLIAALTLAEWFCGEMGQKIMCASNDYEQASLIFDCINNFREESRAMASVTRKNVKGIFFGNFRQRKKIGKFTLQNKGTIKKMSAKSGAKEGRNLKIVIVDEVHEMLGNDTVAPLRSSLTTQDEPLYFEITTEGMVSNGYLDKRLAMARLVLKGEIVRKNWLVWLYTQDSEREIWEDETSWTKSNPLLGITKKREELQLLLEDAKYSGAARAFTLAKEFNLKQLRQRAWLKEEYLQSADTFALADFTGKWAICGVDLAETNDLAAISYLFLQDEKKYCHTMYFSTEKMATEGRFNDNQYRLWQQQGLIRIVGGTVIDDDAVVKYMKEIYDNYKIRPYKVGYDSWGAKEFVKLASKIFGENVTIKIKMSCEALNTPTRTLEEDLRQKLFNFQNNPICRWCFQNTGIHTNSKGLVMPEKLGSSAEKIDGTMAKVIAYATLRECKSAFLSKFS